MIETKDGEVAALRAQLEACQAQLEELRAEVETLRARLRQNPRNSSRPPSSEGLAKPAPRSLRRRSGRKPGRPKGQPGATLEMTDRPDEVVSHEPDRCARCGAGLFGAPVTRTERRQVVDLPEQIRALVTGHRIICRRCSCGTVTAGKAPAGAGAPVQYGPHIAAVAVYLWHGQFLLGRRSQARRNEQRADLIAVQAGGVRFVVDPWPADVHGRGLFEQFFLDRIAVEPGDRAEPPHHRGPGPSRDLQVGLDACVRVPERLR